MAGKREIFHPGFKASPYWWEAWTPGGGEPAELPARTDVAIVGGGYAGLSARSSWHARAPSPR
jgi:NADPH-dependent 2,4-dienoyl-CoA reductase/sulfur reductase-like enzyme